MPADEFKPSPNAPWPYGADTDRCEEGGGGTTASLVVDGGAPSASDRPFAPSILEPGEASGEGSDSSAAVFLLRRDEGGGGPSLLVGVITKFDAVVMLDMFIECNDDDPVDVVVVVMLNDLRDFFTSPESEVLLDVDVDEAGTGTGQ